MGKPKLPDFLGIGAARSGTTWLAAQLEHHPDVWIPRIKELHYFSRAPKYHGPSHLSDSNLFRRLLYPGEAYKKYRSHLARSLASNLIRPSLKKLIWDFNFLFREPSDEWYASLFSPAGDRLAGEITPQYSVLDEQDIASLHALMPNCKILFIVRDPVDRAWSLLRYHEKRFTRNLTAQPIPKLIEEAFHPAKVAQSDYSAILARWRHVFPKEQFMLAFYDEITESPNDLMSRVCDFLGIAPICLSSDKNSRINESFSKEMPQELRSALIDYYRRHVEVLSEQEGGYFSKWLASYCDFPANS